MKLYNNSIEFNFEKVGKHYHLFILEKVYTFSSKKEIEDWFKNVFWKNLYNNWKIEIGKAVDEIVKPIYAKQLKIENLLNNKKELKKWIKQIKKK